MNPKKKRGLLAATKFAAFMFSFMGASLVVSLFITSIFFKGNIAFSVVATVFFCFASVFFTLGATCSVIYLSFVRRHIKAFQELRDDLKSSTRIKDFLRDNVDQVCPGVLGFQFVRLEKRTNKDKRVNDDIDSKYEYIIDSKPISYYLYDLSKKNNGKTIVSRGRDFAGVGDNIGSAACLAASLSNFTVLIIGFWLNFKLLSESQSKLLSIFTTRAGHCFGIISIVNVIGVAMFFVAMLVFASLSVRDIIVERKKKNKEFLEFRDRRSAGVQEASDVQGNGKRYKKRLLDVISLSWRCRVFYILFVSFSMLVGAILSALVGSGIVDMKMEYVYIYRALTFMLLMIAGVIGMLYSAALCPKEVKGLEMFEDIGLKVVDFNDEHFVKIHTAFCKNMRSDPVLYSTATGFFHRNDAKSTDLGAYIPILTVDVGNVSNKFLCGADGNNSNNEDIAEYVNLEDDGNVVVKLKDGEEVKIEKNCGCHNNKGKYEFVRAMESGSGARVSFYNDGNETVCCISQAVHENAKEQRECPVQIGAIRLFNNRSQSSNLR